MKLRKTPKPEPAGYMTTAKERQSYWTYFTGQNAYYYLTATFLSTYLAMQGVDLVKVGIVLLIVKITAAISSSLALFLLGLFNWVSVEASDFAELEALGVTQTPQAMTGLWIVYALIPTIGLAIAGVFYLFYKLSDKDVQIMAKCNSGEITREEAEAQLSRKF